MSLRRNECANTFEAQFAAISNIIKSALTKKNLDNFKGDKEFLKKYVDEELKSIESLIKENLIEGNREGIDEIVANIVTEAARRRVIILLDTYKSTNRVLDDMDKRLENAKDINEVQGAIETAFIEYKRNAIMASRKVDTMLAQAVENVKVRGKAALPENASKAINLLGEAFLKGKFSKLTDYIKSNVTDEQGKPIKNADRELFLACARGGSKDPVIDLLQSILMGTKERVAKDTQSKAPYMNLRDGHVTSLRPVESKVSTKGKELFEDKMMRGLKFEKMLSKGASEAQKKALVKELWEEFTTSKEYTSGGINTKGVFSHRRLEFNRLEDEWDFIETYMDLDRGIVGAMYDHMQKLAKSAAYHNTLGPDMNFMSDNLERFFRNHKLTKDNQKFLDKATDEIRLQMSEMDYKVGNMMLGKASYYAMIRASSSTLSFMLTGKSAARNFLFDNTIHAAMVRKFLLDESLFLAFFRSTIPMMTRTFTPEKLRDKIKSDFLGMTPDKEMRDVLELMGHSIKVRLRHQAEGITEDMLTRGHGLQGKGNKLSTNIESGANALADANSWFSFGDASAKSGRLTQAIRMSKFISMSVDKGWNSLPMGVKNAARQLGFDEAHWEALRYVPKYMVKGLLGKESKFALKTDEFDKIPDEIIAPLKRKLESSKDAKIRLMYMYDRLLGDAIDMAAPVVSGRGKLGAQSGKVWSDFLIQNNLKFSNIALSQYKNLMRAASLGADVNPDGVYGAMGNLEQWTKIAKNRPDIAMTLLGGFGAGIAMLIWGRDMLSGKTPRELKPEDFLEGMAEVGFGGIAGNVVGSILHSDDLFQSPTDAYVKPAKGVVKGTYDWFDTGNSLAAKKAYINAIQRYGGFTNTMQTAAISKYLLRRAADVPTITPQERRLDRKLEREDWANDFFDELLSD